MPFVYTVPLGFGRQPRAYVRLRIGDADFPAVIDTGADGSVISELQALDAQVAYVAAPRSIGVAGPVPTFRTARSLSVTILAPRRRRGVIEWVEIGKHQLRPLVIPSAVPMPALVGRTDILVSYRLVLVEARQEFDLQPLG